MNLDVMFIKAKQHIISSLVQSKSPYSIVWGLINVPCHYSHPQITCIKEIVLITLY